MINVLPQHFLPQRQPRPMRSDSTRSIRRVLLGNSYDRIRQTYHFGEHYEGNRSIFHKLDNDILSRIVSDVNTSMQPLRNRIRTRIGMYRRGLSYNIIRAQMMRSWQVEPIDEGPFGPDLAEWLDPNRRTFRDHVGLPNPDSARTMNAWIGYTRMYNILRKFTDILQERVFRRQQAAIN